ncbi:MAG: hypothetical protein Q7J82_09555 [Coriobacteriia bacterium]|nr:hypothetical protein [Coriobacteriia bacterium]
MKKMIAVLTTVVLLSVLVVPGTALAAKGGNDKVKNTPPGQAKKEAPVDPDAVADVPTEDTSADVVGSEKHFKKVHREQVRVSEEGSATVEPKKTGIANALSRIEVNLERAQQKVLDGTKKALPPGLVRVYEKFMSWLGMTPDESTPDDS